jgi:adenosylmethionine-8-amino-7-oxononanoate aminotransferase
LRHLQLIDEWELLVHVRARSADLQRELDARVYDLDAVDAIRVWGLMGAVELAPPGPGLRWGRRVCAEAVRHGVLLRPLGDVVVLMPPLTVTANEITLIVDALVAGIADVTG